SWLYRFSDNSRHFQGGCAQGGRLRPRRAVAPKEGGCAQGGRLRPRRAVAPKEGGYAQPGRLRPTGAVAKTNYFHLAQTMRNNDEESSYKDQAERNLRVEETHSGFGLLCFGHTPGAGSIRQWPDHRRRH